MDHPHSPNDIPEDLLRSRLSSHLQRLQHHLQEDIRKLSRMKRVLTESPGSIPGDKLLSRRDHPSAEHREHSDHGEEEDGEAVDWKSVVTGESHSILINASDLPAGILDSDDSDSDKDVDHVEDDEDKYGDQGVDIDLEEWVNEWESGAKRTREALQRIDSMLLSCNEQKSDEHGGVIAWIDSQLRESLDRAQELSDSISNLIEYDEEEEEEEKKEEEDGNVMDKEEDGEERRGGSMVSYPRFAVVAKKSKGPGRGALVIRKWSHAPTDMDDTWSMSTDDTDTTCMSTLSSIGIDASDTDSDIFDDLSDMLSTLSGDIDDDDDDFFEDERFDIDGDDDEFGDDSCYVGKDRAVNTGNRRRRIRGKNSKHRARHPHFKRRVKEYAFTVRRLISLLNSSQVSPRLSNVLSSIDILVTGFSNSLLRTFRITHGWISSTLQRSEGRGPISSAHLLSIQEGVASETVGSPHTRSEHQTGFLLPNHLGWKASATFNTHTSAVMPSESEVFTDNASSETNSEEAFPFPSLISAHDCIRRLAASWFDVFD